MSSIKKADWIISNCLLSRAEWSNQAEWKGIHCASESPFPEKIHEGTVVILDGYVLPRIGKGSEKKPFLGGHISFLNTEEFSRSVKGHFSIVWAGQKGLTLCVDHHGLSKVFYSQIGEKWWVSNSLPNLVKMRNPGIDEIGIALFNIYEHFVGNRTLFANIRYSQPATVLELNEKKIIESIHWNPLQWIDKPKINTDMIEWKTFWEDLISGYSVGLNAQENLLTLTGGNDSRLVLAALLALGIKPSTFTFGNPVSYDSVIAKEIIRQVGIEHHCHYVDQPNNLWFRNCAQEIIRKGNGLINIHRSHRLDAVKKEAALTSKKSILFTGFMGGDYLKGLSYDDYITSKFHRLWNQSIVNKKKHLEAIVDEKCLILPDSLKECLLDEVFPSFKFNDTSLDLRIRELMFLFHVIGSLHDYQDTCIFSWEISDVVNPFMDVDFLEHLWSSPYSSLDSKVKGSASRVNFICQLTHKLVPEMSNTPYAKWGGYSANEVILHPKILKLKRILRHLANKDRYIRNFQYGEWFHKFSKDELSRLHHGIKPYYNLVRLLNKLAKEPLGANEREWHIVTNPINLSMNLQYFTEKRDENLSFIE